MTVIRAFWRVGALLVTWYWRSHFACLKSFRSENCYIIVGRELQYPGSNTLVLKAISLIQKKLLLKIERTTQKKSHWLFLFLLCIASTLTLVNQSSVVICTIDLDVQESSISIVGLDHHQSNRLQQISELHHINNQIVTHSRRRLRRKDPVPHRTTEGRSRLPTTRNRSKKQNILRNRGVE